MFGYIAANLHDLSEAEQQRYRAAYCGLCSVLKEHHGQLSRFSLTYDMAFLVLLLGSLYEPEERTGSERCPAHPAKPHPYLRTRFTDYAADLSVALAYHKCLDDWNDDRKLRARAYAGVLGKQYAQVKQRLPRQCGEIEAALAGISAIEQAALAARTAVPGPDAGANLFGRLLGELFAVEDDLWAPTLREFGAQLGRFIYFMDAACDLHHDLQAGSYNPLAELELEEDDVTAALAMFAGRAAAQFEKLPLEKDLHLLRSVLYSGIWQKRNAQQQKESKRAARRTAAAHRSGDAGKLDASAADGAVAGDAEQHDPSTITEKDA